MGKKLNIVLQLLGHYKYLITIILGVVLVVFVDDNSIIRRIRYSMEISKLKQEISKYDAEDRAATERLQELRRNPKAIEKIARERYFMKADDEDIYVLSDDPKPETRTYETTE